MNNDKIIQANADGSLKEQSPPTPEAITLFPFPDGTVLKYQERVPAVASQQTVVNFRGDMLAIAKDANCATMICDGVNILFASLTKKQEIENEILARSMKNATPIESPQLLTRNGLPARIILRDRNNPFYPVVALVKEHNEMESVVCLTAKGSYYADDTKAHDFDIAIPQ